MAIDIYREPDVTSTPYLPVYFDCSSDLGTITSMIADVYVNGSLVSTIDKDPIFGTTNTFRFEVGEILKKHFTNDITTTAISPKAVRVANGSDLNFYIRAFEVEDNGTTFDTSWTEAGAGTNYQQSNTRYAIDGLVHNTQLFNDYICATDTNRILTNRPFVTGADKAYKSSKLLRNQPFELGFLAEQDVQFRYQEFNSSFGTLVDTSFSTTTYVNGKYYFQHDGSYNASTKYVRFRVWDAFGQPINQVYIFELVDSCGNETILYWKNQYGAYDYYFFEGNIKKKSRSKQKYASKRLDYNFDKSDRGKRVISSENTETYEIYTKTENRRTIDWLHEILQSTDVYLYQQEDSVRTSNIYTPIIVTGGSSLNTDDESPVGQFSLTFVYANPKESQIG